MLIMYIKKRFSIHEVLDLYRKYIFYTYYIASLRMLMPMQVFRVKPDRGRRFTVAAWACACRFERESSATIARYCKIVPILIATSAPSAPESTVT